MASSRGMAPGVLLPTVPSMSSGGSPTKGTSPKASQRVVRVPRASVKATVKGPRIKVARPKMPKDANLLMVPKAKRIKGGKPFRVGKKPII